MCIKWPCKRRYYPFKVAVISLCCRAPVRNHGAQYSLADRNSEVGLLGLGGAGSGAAVRGSQSACSMTIKTWKLVGSYAELHQILRPPVLVNQPLVCGRERGANGHISGLVTPVKEQTLHCSRFLRLLTRVG